MGEGWWKLALQWRRNRTGDTPTAAAGVTDLLRGSGLVDVDYYCETNPDVAATGIDPIDHYASWGGYEARNPNPFFDSAWYLTTNGDVRDIGLNPLLHYINGGAAEGRSAGPNFDTAYYIAQNPELANMGMNPLLHYIRYGRAEGRVAVPYDVGEAFEVAIRASQRRLTGPAAALYAGVRAEYVHIPLKGRDEPSSVEDLPLPPLRLAQRVGSVSLEHFEQSGHTIRQTITRILPKDWDWNGKRCLDFGSGIGRTLRHFAVEADQAEFWGCDNDGSSVRWSVENLSPPFRFFQMTDSPALPFEDNSFDLVYAVSVFGRIHLAWHQWLMEIRRVLKPGGYFLATFLGPTPMAEILAEPYYGRGTEFGMYIKSPFEDRSNSGPNVFVSTDWLKSYWGSIFDIDYIAIDGLMEYESLIVARKPGVGAPIRRQTPVLKLSTVQPFNPDVSGRIHPQVDILKPYRQSYGLELKARNDEVVEGWVVYRSDVVQEVEIMVDRRTMRSKVSIELGSEYRDWNSRVANFSATLDLSNLVRGVHKLEAHLRSREGRVHCLSIPLLIRQ